MKRGYSASTIVLVVLLLGVLVWVGKVVNPPGQKGHDDHDHDTPAAQQAGAAKLAPAKGPDPKTLAAEKAHQIKMQQEMQKKMMAEHALQAKNAPPPKSDDMDASFWTDHNMGTVAAKPDTKTP